VAQPFLVKDIALQSGTSVATVDRVLNQRGGVRQHTVRRVEQAIRELEQQAQQIGLSGRKYLVDVVMCTPLRFSQLVQQAIEAVVPTLQPAVFRMRYHLVEEYSVDGLLAALHKIAINGSAGVLLKAPDEPTVVAAIARLVERGIPVVTLVTDIPQSARCAYVGVDNRAAGRTAAYLFQQWLGRRRGRILLSLSSSRFRGEEEREIGFRQAIRAFCPQLQVVDVSGGMGLHDLTARLVQAQLRQHEDIHSVYSIGGGNSAILEVFARRKRRCDLFVAHDLDDENSALLQRGSLHAVLHHDLRHDVRQACLHLMAQHGAVRLAEAPRAAPVQIVTPFNVPSEWLLRTG